jgi:hypothetical protein
VVNETPRERLLEAVIQIRPPAAQTSRRVDDDERVPTTRHEDDEDDGNGDGGLVKSVVALLRRGPEGEETAADRKPVAKNLEENIMVTSADKRRMLDDIR